jgi:hypothetical protein
MVVISVAQEILVEVVVRVAVIDIDEERELKHIVGKNLSLRGMERLNRGTVERQHACPNGGVAIGECRVRCEQPRTRKKAQEILHNSLSLIPVRFMAPWAGASCTVSEG